MRHSQVQQAGLFISEVDREYKISPEQTLIIHIIRRAIFDLASSDENLSSDAHFWIFGELNQKPFNFRWCVEHIANDTAGMISALRRIAKTVERRKGSFFLVNHISNRCPVMLPLRMMENEN